LAGAFLAVDLRRRRLAGAFLAAALRRRRLAGAFLAAAFLRRFAGRRAVVLRAVDFLRRFAGLRAVFFVADFRAVRLFAGGTVTTFLLGCDCCRRSRLVSLPAYFTADLKPAPAVNFTPFDAAI